LRGGAGARPAVRRRAPGHVTVACSPLGPASARRYDGAVSEPPFDFSTLPEEAQQYVRERFREGIEDRVPHNRALGLRYEGFDGRRLVVRLPYDARLVGNPSSGVLHGGAITALMDATAGTAVFARLLKPMRIATLDLRIDYLKPARPGVDVIARAECFKTTTHVAFVRCETSHAGDASDLIAVANGTFMIFRDEKHRSHVGDAP
jgi:uncharacterized protein (TIGR00369 family)